MSNDISLLCKHLRTWAAMSAIVIAVTSAAISANAAVLTGPVLNPSNGHTYYLLSQNKWTASETEAITLHGHLVTINDKAENDWVFSTFSSFGGIPRALWIGYSDQSQEGTFVWSSGEFPGFTHWAPPQPDNGSGSEDYAHMLFPGHPHAGKWNDYQNLSVVLGVPLFGVVEVVPEPSTWLMLALGLTTLVGVRTHRIKRLKKD